MALPDGPVAQQNKLADASGAMSVRGSADILGAGTLGGIGVIEDQLASHAKRCAVRNTAAHVLKKVVAAVEVAGECVPSFSASARKLRI